MNALVINLQRIGKIGVAATVVCNQRFTVGNKGINVGKKRITVGKEIFMVVMMMVTFGLKKRITVGKKMFTCKLASGSSSHPPSSIPCLAFNVHI